jgi:hypothetical protein
MSRMFDNETLDLKLVALQLELKLNKAEFELLLDVKLEEFLTLVEEIKTIFATERENIKASFSARGKLLILSDVDPKVFDNGVLPLVSSSIKKRE